MVAATIDAAIVAHEARNPHAKGSVMAAVWAGGEELAPFGEWASFYFGMDAADTTPAEAYQRALALHNEGCHDRRPDLYDVAMALYGSHTGSNDSAYASWSDYGRTKEQDIAYLRARLAGWTDRPASAAVDDAFKAWLVAILDVVDGRSD